MSSRAARRLEAQQLKLETQENSVDTGTPQEDYCESLPSRLGFVAAAPVCEHFDSPAHMLPGPEPCIGGTPEPVECNMVRLQALNHAISVFLCTGRTSSMSMLFDVDDKL